MNILANSHITILEQLEECQPLSSPFPDTGCTFSVLTIDTLSTLRAYKALCAVTESTLPQSLLQPIRS